MGMYDSITINKKLLPVNENLKNRIPNGQIYQTKSLSRLLYHYTINSSSLKIHKSEWEDDGTYRDIAGIKFPNKKLIKKWTEKIDYTGKIVFYTDLDNLEEHDPNKWLEFEAKFISGKMINIKRINNEETT